MNKWDEIKFAIEQNYVIAKEIFSSNDADDWVTSYGFYREAKAYKKALDIIIEVEERNEQD